MVLVVEYKSNTETENVWKLIGIAVDIDKRQKCIIIVIQLLFLLRSFDQKESEDNTD